MTVKVKKCTQLDLPQLQEMSIRTFKETFGEQNTPENLETYLERAYNDQQLGKELADPFSTFFFIYFNNELAGYLKLNVQDSQTEDIGTEGLEIERIYVQSAFKRNGLGTILFNLAMQIAAEEQKEIVWLGVWEKNIDAIAFYEKKDFIRTGEHTFFMGDEAQTDFIMTKYLSNKGKVIEKGLG